MSTGRRRKKAARKRSRAQWQATATVMVPPHGDERQPSHPNGVEATTTTAARPRPGAVDEPFGAPVEPLADHAAAPPDVMADLFSWEDSYQDDRGHEIEDNPDRGHELQDDAVREDDADGEVVAPTRGARRRRVVALAVAAPVMFVAAFVAGGWLINQMQGEPLRTDPPVVPSSAVPSRSVPVTPTRSGSTTFVPGSGAGPGLTAPGALVQATPTADGSLEVVEQVRFAKPVKTMVLGPPLTEGVAARSLPNGVEVLDLQMRADTSVVDIGQGRLTSPRTIDLPGSTSTVVMRYRLTGATVRSIPSTPGRALTVLPPITSPTTLESLPFVIEMSGDTVTNVLCPGLPTADQLCGRTWKLGWYSPPQPAGHTAVLAQLNLPDPVGG